MSLEGLQIASATENIAPYSLYGDYRNGRDVRDLRGGPLPPGPYTITATAYSKKRGTGTVVGTLAVSFEVLVPPALSVADARAEEGVDAALDFAVTLNRASVGTVTVDYATGYGTASRGRDYIAKSGTLTFAAGETEKTVSVTVLDDALDEGNEWVALRLSNPSGATIADSEAVGRISNDGPIPQAWLARFGRTVTGQVLDAVEARLAAPGAPGAKASLAGQALPSWRGGTAAADDDAARQRREDREAGAALASMTAWLAQMDPDVWLVRFGLGGGEERGPGKTLTRWRRGHAVPCRRVPATVGIGVSCRPCRAGLQEHDRHCGGRPAGRPPSTSRESATTELHGRQTPPVAWAMPVCSTCRLPDVTTARQRPRPGKR